MCDYSTPLVTALSFNTTATDLLYRKLADLIPWSNLSSIPSACDAGHAFSDISGTGTCTAFLTSYSETDPFWSANSSTVARAGSCPSGQYVQNTTTSGVQCVADNPGTVTSITASSPLTGGIITTSGTIGIPAANSSTDGYLSSGDWTTFNNKVSASSSNVCTYGIANFSINGGSTATCADQQGTVTSITFSSPLTGGTITGSGTVGITQANTSTDGYLSSTDWNTFNGKLGSVPYQSTAAGMLNYTNWTATITDEGLLINTTTTKPSCAAATRGGLWVSQGAAGVTDYLYICLKNSSDSYNWVQVARGD
jgi:hypothetical protein